MVACDIVESVGIYRTHRHLVHQDLRNTVSRKRDNLEPPLLAVSHFYRTERMDDPVHRGAHAYRVSFQIKGCRDSSVSSHID